MIIANQGRTAFYILGEEAGGGIEAYGGCVYLIRHGEDIKLGDYHNGSLSDYYIQQTLMRFPGLKDRAENLPAEAVVEEILEAMLTGEEFFCLPFSYPPTSDSDYEWEWKEE